ncbi:MAG TPA: sulfotransferase domain-containing protein [Pseudomonadales bacterium]
MTLSPDAARIAMMKRNIADIHAFFQADKKGKAGILLRHQFKKHYFILPPAWRILLRMRSADRRMLPSFTSTGVIRSGTSSMSNYILQHPCVVMPLSKELGALSPRLNAVKAQFPLLKEAEKVRQQHGVAMTGDCTPILPGLSQLYWMQAVNPDMKYVITLRDPVERTLSHWRWHKMITRVFADDPLWRLMPDMEHSLRLEMQGFADGDIGFVTFCGASSTGFVRQSCYLPFLQQLFREVPRERILIVQAEQLFREPERVVAGVYDFLGLPDYRPVHIEETNPSDPVVASDALREELRAFFRPHNLRLYDFLGRDFGWQ